MINIKVIGSGNLFLKLKRASNRDVLKKELNSIAEELVTYIVTQKLSGQVLKRQSGRLARAVGHKYSEEGGAMRETIGVFSAPFYVVHEEGRVIHGRPFMYFFLNRSNISVRAAKVVIPARPVFGPTIDEKKQMIVDRISKAYDKILGFA